MILFWSELSFSTTPSPKISFPLTLCVHDKIKWPVHKTTIVDTFYPFHVLLGVTKIPIIPNVLDMMNLILEKHKLQ